MNNKRLILFISLFLTFINLSAQTDTIYLYGPGGPYPAMNEAAKIYSKQHNVIIKVTKGPLKNWKIPAKTHADIIYSGSEFMMTNFIRIFNPAIIQGSVTPLYLRKSGLLVRPGNPLKIEGMKDLTKPGIRILVVNGAGLTGVWEDMAGRTQNLEFLKNIRKNIVFYAANSGVAKKEWSLNKNIDVWITWNIWQISNPHLADFVPVKERYTIYRDCGIALTQKGNRNKAAAAFFNFLKSKNVMPVFEKWGWQTQ